MLKPSPYGWISQYFLGFFLRMAFTCHFGRCGLKNRGFFHGHWFTGWFRFGDTLRG
ncbi:hypothetical protein QYZ42_10275 [Vibrio parahaemolyticus]|nr:hypothetical protein [Vibrio parahaemolyticus]